MAAVIGDNDAVHSVLDSKLGILATMPSRAIRVGSKAAAPEEKT
jgi:hypothetical protein